MFFADAAATINGSRRTRDGYLVADVRFARTGIYDYRGIEVGRPDLDLVRVYRPVVEVFAASAMRSFALKPVTIDHPSDGLSAATWKSNAVGHLGPEIRRDGQFVAAEIIIHDAAAISQIESGLRELSAGYQSSLSWTNGWTDSDEPYDAIMGSIVGNHVALVSRGRAGHQCRIGGAQ